MLILALGYFLSRVKKNKAKLALFFHYLNQKIMKDALKQA